MTLYELFTWPGRQLDEVLHGFHETGGGTVGRTGNMAADLTESRAAFTPRAGLSRLLIRFSYRFGQMVMPCRISEHPASRRNM